jgi:hypothetical protein
LPHTLRWWAHVKIGARLTPLWRESAQSECGDMSKLRSSFIVALVLIGCGVPLAAHAEGEGVSAVPDTFSSPPPPVRTPHTSAPTHTSTMQPSWHAATFPAPNGGQLVFRIMPNGNPACASYNGRDCLWGQRAGQIDFNRVQPLECGSDHRAKFGVTGYEDSKHWCRMAKSM